MAVVLSPDISAPKPEQLNSPKPVEQQKRPLSERAQGLLKKFLPWIQRPKPEPDKALEIMTEPLEEPDFTTAVSVLTKKAPGAGNVEPENEQAVQKEEILSFHLDLATHGQKTEHLFKMYEMISKMGLEKALRLRSKEENNYLGIGVKAYSAFGGGEEFETGESRTSFYQGGLYGAGEVNWVMPTSKVMRKGGYIETAGFYNPEKEGMAGRRAEFGHYSELGFRLRELGEAEDRQKRISEIKIALESTGSNLTFLTYLQKYQLQDGEKILSDERAQEVWRHPSILGREELEAVLENEAEKAQSQVRLLKDSLKEVEGSNGVDLLDPQVVCFVPQEKFAVITDQIKNLPISEQEKSFMRKQLVGYKNDMELDDFIRQLEDDPAKYAELIGKNIESQNTTDSKQSILQNLKAAEESLEPERFQKVKATVYKVISN
jgi:hypothetical protein